MTMRTVASPDDIYAFIVAFVDKHGYSPTTREISKGVGLSSQSSVQRTLNILLSQDRITMVRGQSRTVRPRIKERKD